MTAAEILALLESDPAAGILATADLIEQVALRPRDALEATVSGEQLIAEIAAHPRSALIEVLADTMQAIEDDDGNGRHINYYRSLAYVTVELLPGLFYDEDALCDESGCGAHPERRSR